MEECVWGGALVKAADYLSRTQGFTSPMGALSTYSTSQALRRDVSV